ncbi:H-type lectin domain protein (macronuclear) [Tetrahymena thermophila SB210]|uniref:H-type lectin domain protein n=1 Tax=Tetrahymena thermophila (strain SB210) TaxID=312017 RepID=Q23C48_TETTS|nr:H-type lectin domain protein [Tetrahymena thermophila SB210]EAR93920.2 H-type lectin domain protein [Tetrahymena thermophila SB210]|eukprot:XP_001014165.2 H-type lectin domain protein [Tetrahymena thermophila SB210]
MKLKTYSLLLFYFIFSILVQNTVQQQNITQSDRIFIKQEQQVWQKTQINPYKYQDFSVDLSFGKFQKTPKVVYGLTVYNSDYSSNQGFLLQTNSVNQTSLSYRLQSEGCTLVQLGFNILAIDDPNVEVQQKILQSGVTTIINGTQSIQQIAGFIYGFQGNSQDQLVLKYSLTKIDSMSYKIQFSNQNIQTVYMNFLIIYQNSSPDIFQQLYAYQSTFDSQSHYLGGSDTQVWTSSTFIDYSQIFFGLKDFGLTSGGCILCDYYFGVKIQSLQNQIPEAQNKQVQLQYFSCCVKSCNTIDHHYNTNPSNTHTLYSTTISYCQQCDPNCYGCQDGNPSSCTDCYNNQYLNPNTNSCDQTPPPNTFCQITIIQDQSYYNCQKCDSTCQQCSAAADPNSCLSCDTTSQNKYFYNNKCYNSQPDQTFCDSNFICQTCDQTCGQCQAPGNANSCTSCNKFAMNNNQNKLTVKSNNHIILVKIALKTVNLVVEFQKRIAFNVQVITTFQ